MALETISDFGLATKFMFQPFWKVFDMESNKPECQHNIQPSDLDHEIEISLLAFKII